MLHPAGVESLIRRSWFLSHLSMTWPAGGVCAHCRGTGYGDVGQCNLCTCDFSNMCIWGHFSLVIPAVALGGLCSACCQLVPSLCVTEPCKPGAAWVAGMHLLSVVLLQIEDGAQDGPHVACECFIV